MYIKIRFSFYFSPSFPSSFSWEWCKQVHNTLQWPQHIGCAGMCFVSQKLDITCQHTTHKYFAERTPCQQARHMTEPRYDAMSHHVKFWGEFPRPP
jgi:hypothetical protein